MHPSTRLKALINDQKLLVMPGAYDALSARVIERAGFDAVQVSGFGVSASSLGQIDASFTSLTDVVNATRNIVNAVDIAVMSDVDTGYGNAVNTHWSIRQIGLAGAAGANLEDQIFPKICGFTNRQVLIDSDEMVKKIEAAVDARVHPDFIINARTDALVSHGVDEAVRRGNAYAAAGADLIYVLVPEYSPELIRDIVDRIDAPVSMALHETAEGTRPTIQDYQDLGLARLSAPLSPVLTVVAALEQAMADLRRGSTDYLEGIATFERFNEVLGEADVLALEEKYAV